MKKNPLVSLILVTYQSQALGDSLPNDLQREKLSRSRRLFLAGSVGRAKRL